MTDILLRQSLDVNTKIYNRLKAALRLNLRRQIFVAVCDDLALRDRLADQLQKEVTYAAISARRRGQLAEARRLRIYPRLVTLHLDLADPNPINQMSQWLRQFPPPAAAGSAMPAFQLLGIEQLSRQPASSQWLFLNHLQSVERSLPALESSLLLWVPRPWGRMIPQSAPDFWRCRTAVFEFEGDPTPLPAAALPQSTVPTSIFIQPQRQSPLPKATSQGTIDLSPDEVALLKSELPMPSSDMAPLPSSLSSGDGASSMAALPAADGTSVSKTSPEPIEASPTGADTPITHDEQTTAASISAPSTEDLPPPQQPSPAEKPSSPPLTTPLTPPNAAQAQDLGQALRELLGDSASGPDESATTDPSADMAHSEERDAGAEAVPDSALQNGLQNDAVESETVQNDTVQNDTVPNVIPYSEAAQQDAAPFETSHTDRVPPDPLPIAQADSEIYHLEPEEDNLEQDDTFDVPLGLPPLADTFTLDDLDPFDPADLDLTVSGDSEESIDPSTRYDVDYSDSETGDDELEIVDAAPHYVYSGVVDSPSQSASAPAMPAPSNLMQLFADEASDPRVLNILSQIRGLQDQQAPPTVLAGAYRALGNLFRDRIEQGEISPPTLQRAMAAYEQVLHYTPESSPMRAEVLNDMGNLSWLLSRCSQGPEQCLPHLHHSIQSYQQALVQIAPDTHPQTYPMIQNNLGAAYGDLARYQNPAENLQKSTQAYQEALRYRSAEQDPMRYASTQNNLGTTYWNLAQHQEPIHHLKAAIASYDSALTYYKPEQDALNYAMIQNNLGTAYWNLAQHEHSEEWLRQAINAYQLALEYRTLTASPAAFAATQNNLGTAHWHVANYIDEEPQARFNSLQQAMRAYEAALQAVDYLQQSDRPTPLNFDVTATRNNLGLVQYQTATDSQFDTAELSETYLNTALEHHLAALQGWQGRPELRQTAMNCVIQTLQAIYKTKGLVGQNLALSNVPGQLLPEILPKL